jgi:hypothetical protein
MPFAVDYGAVGKKARTNGAGLRQRMDVRWPPSDDASRYFFNF